MARSNILPLLIAIVGSITAGDLLVNEQIHTGLLTVVITATVVALIYALQDYEEWDERTTRNAERAAYNTLKGVLGTLALLGATTYDKGGWKILAGALFVFALWAVIYLYYNWRDTH